MDMLLLLLIITHIEKIIFISKLYFFVSHRYLYFVYEPPKLFGPGPKIILIRVCLRHIQIVRLGE